MKPTVIRPEIDPARRILVTSDIHGHPLHLRRVLDLAGFGGDDLLIVAGDLIEKGPDSLGALRTVMALCHEGRAMATVGNVDLWRLQIMRLLADCPDKAKAEWLFHYMNQVRQRWGSSFYEEMARESGCSVNSTQDILTTYCRVLNDHRDELDFLDTLPTVLAAERYIFVHGGLPTAIPEDVEAMDPYAALKRDWYLHEVRERDLRFDPYVVVGHFPTTLYRDKIPCANPIIDTDHHVICMDGGCGIKPDAQINLLVLPSIQSDGTAATWVSWDDFPKIRAEDAQDESQDSFNLRWGDCDVRVVSVEGDCSLVEHLRTGRCLWVPSDYLYADGTQCRDCTDYRLSIAPGDTLSLIVATGRGYIVKKDGVSGWYYGRIVPL